MHKNLRFEITINAAPGRVWERMLSPDGYRAWTAAFCEGSYFEGSWETASKIRFLSPDGSGMVAEIAENRPLQYLSIRHLGEVKEGVEDTTSEAVRAWAPGYETYTFSQVAGGTRVVAALDCVPAYEAFMNEAFPKALALLKSESERQAQPA